MQEFELTYEFSQITLLREPLFLVGFFASILLLVIIVNRLDFSLSPAEKSKLKQQ